MSNAHHFIRGGFDRARAAMKVQLRAAVEAEFALEIQQATSLLERIRLERRLRREVDRRLRNLLRPDALY
jgi:hypothetical protein